MRLIDADALTQKYCADCSADVQDECKIDPVCASLMWVADEPTVEDAVVVVRCKDCMHSSPIDTKVSPFMYYRPECVLCKCEEVVGDEPMVYLPDHFCSHGERKMSDE